MRFPTASLLPVLAWLLATGCGSFTADSSPPTSGSPAPAASPSACSSGSIRDLPDVWESDSGAKIRMRDLPGQVRVFSMFYTTCEGICEVTKQDLQGIEAGLSSSVRDRVGFVLVTFDASRDSASALRAYRTAGGLSPVRWTLLRGDAGATGRLAKLLGINSGRDSAGRFIHSSDLVLVDPSGRIVRRHNGLRADLVAITREIEAMAELPR